MKQNITSIFFVSLLIVSVFLISGEILPDKNNKYDLMCNVKIENPPFFASKITEVSCSSKKSGLFSISDIYTDKGKLEMSTQGKTTKRDYKVIEFDNMILKMILTNLNSGTSVVNFVLKNDVGTIISSKSINVVIGG